jgi:hypothetical protein
MQIDDDLTLGDLERQGRMGSAISQLYLRLLGAEWRTVRVRAAHEAVDCERRRHEDGIDLRRGRNRNVA